MALADVLTLDQGADRPTCTACDRRTALRGGLLCPGCRRRLLDNLDELARGYPRLDATPGTSGIDAGRRPAGFESRSPARDDVLVLTDRRRQAHDPDEQANAQSLPRTLAHWADQAHDADLCGLIPTDMRLLCSALSLIVDGLARMWWVGDMAASLDTAVGHLRRALGEVEHTIPIGRCPRPARDVKAWTPGEPMIGAPRCDGEVRAKAFGRTARCRACGHRWDDEAALRELGEQLGDAMLDLPALARYLDGDLSVVLLRKWAQRDQWARVKVGRRTVYRLADARASAIRAWDRAHPVHGPDLPPVHGPALPPAWQRDDEAAVVLERTAA